MISWISKHQLKSHDCFWNFFPPHFMISPRIRELKSSWDIVSGSIERCVKGRWTKGLPFCVLCEAISQEYFHYSIATAITGRITECLKQQKFLNEYWTEKKTSMWHAPYAVLNDIPVVSTEGFILLSCPLYIYAFIYVYEYRQKVCITQMSENTFVFLR